MTGYQFWLAVIDKLPQIVAAISAIIILWRQSVNIHDTKAAIANATSDVQTSVANVHQQINGRMDQLIATTKSDSEQTGATAERERASSITIQRD